MSTQFPSNNPTAYLGLAQTHPVQLWFRNRDPDNSLDVSSDYHPGDHWMNTASGSMWYLVSITNQQNPLGKVSDWQQLASSSAIGIETITGDDSVVIGPTSGNVNILGDVLQGVQTANTAPSTSTITVQDADTVGDKGVSTYDPTYFTASSGLVSLVTPLILPSQPIFSATARLQNSVTGDGTAYVVHYATTTQNVGGGYDGLTTFTAPSTGNYLFNVCISFSGITSAQTSLDFYIGSNNVITCDPYNSGSNTGLFKQTASIMLPMTSGSSVNTTLIVYSGTKSINITASSFFQGFLLF